MNYNYFTVLSKVQDIDIDPSNISGITDGFQSYLNIDVNFTFRPPRQATAFDIILIRAKLVLQNYSVCISEAQELVDANVRWQEGAEKQERDYSRQFKFRINEKAFHLIEKQRKGDLKIGIEFEAMVLVKEEVIKLIQNASSTLRVSARKDCTIPKSIWVEKILPSLGFQTFKLIEIPLTHSFLKEAYDDIIFEFNKAEEAFNNQKYNDCVGHCRLTLDALTRNLKKIKDEVPSETAFKWLENIDKATFTWIDMLNKSSTAISSKPHHAGHKRKFEKYEAEAIYMVVIGLLHYIGNLPNQICY